MRITKVVLAKEKAGTKDRFLWDSELRGFGVKITPKDRRSAVMQYRFEGHSRRVTIGTLSPALTIDQARKEAQRIIAKVHSGIDPAAEKQARRNAATIADLFDQYQKSARWEAKAETTRKTDAGRIRNHILPLIGKEKAATLTPDKIRKMRRDIIAGKTARTAENEIKHARTVVKGGEGTAGQSVVLLRAAFAWAIDEDFRDITENPCAKVEGYQSNERDIAPKPGQYAAIFEALDELERTYRMTPSAANAIRLAAWTGMRRGQLVDLTWQQVDLEAGIIKIAAADHKGGKRTGKPLTIYLSPPAIEMLEGLEQTGGRVFPGANGGKVSLSKPWNRVKEMAELPDGFVMHGLRHSIGATLAAQGMSAVQIAKVLGHTRAQTAERYVAMAEDTRRALAGLVADTIERDRTNA